MVWRMIARHWRRKDARVRWAFSALGGFALVFAFVGFWLEFSCCTLREDTVFQALGNVLQLLQMFTLNANWHDLDNWSLKVASILAALATFTAVFIAFRDRIVRRWKIIWLGLYPARELFIGGGDMAAAILSQRLVADSTRDDRPARWRMAALDRLPETPLDRVIQRGRKRLRPRVLCAEAVDRGHLLDVNAPNARKVWILLGKDRLNLEVAEIVLAARALERKRSKQTLLVAVGDPVLMRAVTDLRPTPVLLREDTQVEFFQPDRVAARQLLLRRPLSLRRWVTRIDALSIETPRGSLAVVQRSEQSVADDLLHLCIVGSGPLAEAILVQAATHFVFSDEPGRVVRLTLIGQAASASVRRIRQRHPVLDPAVPFDDATRTLLPLATIESLDVEPPQLSAGQWDVLQQPEPFDRIYVADEDDLLTFAAARRMLALRDSRANAAGGTAGIVACLNRRRPDARHGNAAWPKAGIELFDIFEQCFDPDFEYPGELADARARIIHRSYVRENIPLETPFDEKDDQDWNRLADPFRWSSRFAADHMDVKLALLGISPADDSAEADLGRRLSDQRVAGHLKRLEHRRFVTERLIDGWLPLSTRAASGGPAPSGLSYAAESLDGEAPNEGLLPAQKNFLHLNETLRPYDKLSEEIQAKDAEIVRVMPACLRAERAMRIAWMQRKKRRLLGAGDEVLR